MQAPKIAQKKDVRARLIGLEYENQLVYIKNGYHITRKDIKLIWKELVKHGWQPTYDKYTKALIGVTKKSKNGNVVVNTDTAVSNLEMAMPPAKDLDDAKREYKKYFSEIIKVTKSFGISPLSLGVTPRKLTANPYDIKTEKGLYLIMEGWCIRQNIQIPTAAHQVCIDVPLDEIVKASNLLSMVSGFIIALTANSVIENDQIQKWKEIRTLHWKMPFSDEIKNIDNIFGGISDKPFDGLSGYFKYIWDATPLAIIKNGEWMRLKDWKISTWQYLNSKKELETISPNKKELRITPDKDDLNLMMMLAWNDAKIHLLVDGSKIVLKDFINSVNDKSLEKYLSDKTLTSYLEVRMCASAPKGEEMVIPALILGLLNNLSELEKFCSKFSWSECKELKDILSIKGMDYSHKKIPVVKHLKSLVSISEKGLKKRKLNEEKYLKPIYSRLEKRQTPADRTIELFNKKGIEGVIKNNLY